MSEHPDPALTQPTKPQIDKQEQYRQVAAGLTPGESIWAVFDCKGLGAGFVGVTDRRLVFQDRSAVGNRVTLMSVPYRAVSSVGFASDKEFLTSGTSTVVVTYSGGSMEATFRGDDKARYVHDVVLHRIL